MFVLMVACDFVTSHATIDRRIYALGGNEKAVCARRRWPQGTKR